MTTHALRLDLYAAIHKTLRLAMTDTLARIGSLDVADAAQRRDVTAQLRDMLDFCRSHVEKENAYVHPAIEARCAGTSLRIAGEHDEHLAAIDALEVDASVLEAAPDAAVAFRLYRHLALFVAENFEHMDHEETAHNDALWSAYTDAELLEIHLRIVSSIAPAEMAKVLHWMLPALNHAERVGLVASMPPQAFDGAMQVARERLSGSESSKLARAFELDALAA
jgi:hypothetical protein